MKINVHFGWTGNLEKPCKAFTLYQTLDTEVKLEAWGTDFEGAIARLMLKIRAIHNQNSGSLPPVREIEVNLEMLILSVPTLINIDVEPVSVSLPS